MTDRLAELERCGNAHRSSDSDIGQALSAIRDARLFRGQHASFQDYYQNRWGFSAAQVNRYLIAAGELPSEHVERRLPERPVLSVYFIQAGPDGPIKIGLAKDVFSRMASLQTASPFRLVLLAVLSDGGARTERKLHRRFRGHRLHGEWFAPSKELLGYIATLIQGTTGYGQGTD